MCVFYLRAQLRSFNDLFTNLKQEERLEILNGHGFVRTISKTDGFDIFNSKEYAVGIDPAIYKTVLNINPSCLVESISIIFVNNEEVTLLDIYNALGNIRKLKGRLYSSFTRKQSVPLFEDATRIVSEKQTTPIADPPPSTVLPRTETMYIKLKDINFGNSYYRSQIILTQNGLSYTLTNFKNISFLFFPVIREEKFIAQLYIEPINEGVLFYIIGGADISDFLASKINIDSAINKRLSVFISWATDGIKEKINK